MDTDKLLELAVVMAAPLVAGFPSKTGAAFETQAANEIFRCARIIQHAHATLSNPA